MLIFTHQCLRGVECGCRVAQCGRILSAQWPVLLRTPEMNLGRRKSLNVEHQTSNPAFSGKRRTVVRLNASGIFDRRSIYMFNRESATTNTPVRPVSDSPFHVLQGLIFSITSPDPFKTKTMNSCSAIRVTRSS